MANWIKVQVTLPESPKIFRLARLLGVGRMEALGYAVRWFCWLDTYCANGSTELTEGDVDALIGRSGITRAFCELEWASVDAEGYVLVLDFDKHNGASSKLRAETQCRVAAHRERKRVAAECNAKGVTGALPKALPEGEFIDNKDGCAGIATLCSGREQKPAPAPDGFGEWLGAMCAVHPSASKSRTLARDVQEAALDAFMRFPDAVVHAELLGAYFKDSRLVDNGFYAPRGQRKFFEDLEDVVAHAERWRKWAGWKPRKVRGTKCEVRSGEAERSGVVKTRGCEVKRCAGVISDEQREAFFREIRDEKGGGV